MQLVLIQLVGYTRHSDNAGKLSSDNCATGCLSKVTSSKLKKLIQPVLIQLVSRLSAIRKWR